MSPVYYFLSILSYGVGSALLAPDWKTGLASTLIGVGLITAVRGLGERLSDKEAT